MLFSKTAKAFDKLHFKKAENLIQLAGQKRKLDELKAKKRKKVAIDAQKAFADIEAIKAAKDKEREEEKKQKRYAQRVGDDSAKATARTMEEKDMEAFIHSWQLE